MLTVVLLAAGMLLMSVMVGVWVRHGDDEPRRGANPCSVLVQDESECQSVGDPGTCENHFFFRGTQQFQCSFNSRLRQCVAVMDHGRSRLCPVQKSASFMEFEQSTPGVEAQRPCISRCEHGYACVPSGYRDAEHHRRRCELTMCESQRDPDKYCGDGARCVTDIDGAGTSRCLRVCSTDSDCELTYNGWDDDPDNTRAGGLSCQTVDVLSVEKKVHQKNRRYCLPSRTLAVDASSLGERASVSSDVPSKSYSSTLVSATLSTTTLSTPELFYRL